MRSASLLGLVLTACADKGGDRVSGDTAGLEGDTATELTWHRDGDGDGFGDPASGEAAQIAP